MNKVWTGVGIIVEKNKHVLMMKRQSSHGFSQYSIPGGAVEPGENLERAAARELYEETGLSSSKLCFLGVTNNLNTYKKEGIHVVSIIFHTNEYSGELSLKEPHKHQALGWYSLDELPQPQFEASDLAIQLMLQNQNPLCLTAMIES